MDGFPLLIFDLGAHRGADTKYYLLRGFRVVAVEANPRLADGLRALIATNDQLAVEGKALSSSSGTVGLHLPSDDTADAWATTSPQQVALLQSAGVRTQAIEVPSISLAELVDRYGTPYYIKCDIEGSDTEFLAMLAQLDSKPPTVSFELTQLGLGRMSLQLRTLRSCGYHHFYIRDQAHLPHATFVNGRIYQIKEMWSGPIGAEIDQNNALSYHKLCHLSFWILLRNRLFGEFGLAGKVRLYGLMKRLARVPGLRWIFYTSWYDVHCFRNDQHG